MVTAHPCGSEQTCTHPVEDLEVGWGGGGGEVSPECQIFCGGRAALNVKYFAGGGGGRWAALKVKYFTNSHTLQFGSQTKNW